MTAEHYGLNREPRMSHNQLAEYLVAQPYRRTSIIREAKFPKTPQIDFTSRPAWLWLGSCATAGLALIT